MIKLIYIPLWFYSNDVDHIGTSSISIIYIPLWFYSNAIRVSPLASSIQIYIPLWFYSNESAIDIILTNNKFTFHYGSILIMS